MPKVKPLTEEQAARWENEALCSEIMNRVKERKGLYDLSDFEVADRLKISPSCYSHMKRGGMLAMRFEVVLKAVYFAGYKLKLEKIEAKPKKQTISAKKDDSYGTIIEGLIRKIVQESMEEVSIYLCTNLGNTNV